MTRVGRHDKKLKTTFQKYINYDMYNTTLRYTYHIMHTHYTHTHIPHYAHITDILNHQMHKVLTHNKVKNFRSSSFGHPNFMPS